MGITVGIDTGHGSNTGGKRTAPFTKDIDINGDGIIDVKKGQQYREHYANVGVAVFLNEEMTRCGFETVKIAWDDANAMDDEDISLSNRQKAIKLAKCDYTASIHFNASGVGTKFDNGRGVEVLIHNSCPKDSKALADKVLEQLIKGSPQANRGVKALALALCNCNAMGTKASILVELGFMTNEFEAQMLMANDKFWLECAQEICKGFCNYTGVKYVEKKSKVTTIYKVQTGAFSKSENADNYLKTVKSKGFAGAYILKENNMYKVQLGAFSVKANADGVVKQATKQGLESFITTN